MADKLTEVKDFINTNTAELFEDVTLDINILNDFLTYFKKMSKRSNNLSTAFDAYLDITGADFEVEDADGNIPSELLILGLREVQQPISNLKSWVTFHNFLIRSVVHNGHIP
jgi:hypothetical protein